MCGIAGFISFEGGACTKSDLSKMGDALRLRGPDEETYYQDEYLSFVFRRLSIVDLDGGTQPIWNEDETLFVSVNGEIYNHLELKDRLKSTHEFRTRSDSEIVLHLYEDYGEKAFELLNGMFAIVIWDTKQKKLLLCRDRIGIKPLYYADVGNGILFGSELKSLLMHPDCPREFNWEDTGKVLQQKPDVATYVKGVHYVPSGHFMQLDASRRMQINRYWGIDDVFCGQDLKPRKPREIEEDYYACLCDSVHKRLMSDVPVGLFLSGGIDSSIIASLASKHNNELHCFTAVERTTYLAGDVGHARKITSDLGLPFYPVYFDTPDIATNFRLVDLENLVCLMESPRFDPEWLFKKELHRVAKQQVPDLKVMLLGQGADEFAGGYSRYLGSRWQSWQEYLDRDVAPSLRESRAYSNGIPERFAAKLSENTYADGSKIGLYKQKMTSLVYQLQHFNLWHEDRTSAYNQIESRVPFLDHRLVELLASVPEELESSFFWDKAIVRSALKKCLPDYPRHHKKVPFFVTDDMTSINRFVQSVCLGIFPEFEEKYIQDADFLFDRDEVNALLDQIKNKTRYRDQCAWELMEIMCVSIFNAYIKTPDVYLDQYFAETDRTLPLIGDNQWGEVEERFRQTTEELKNEPWLLESVITIPQHCQMVNPLTEEEGATEVILINKKDNNLRIRIRDDHYWIVKLLDAMGRHMDDPKDIAYWSKALNVPPDELVNIVHNLVEGGFVDRLSEVKAVSA